MPVHIPTCHHFKTNGVFCGSPALRGHRFCYFHHQWREDEPEEKPDAKPAPFELPLLEDANAVQLALQRVMQAILHDEIDNRKAGLLLYALQTASSNLKRTKFEHYKLGEQANAEYANADPAQDDDPDACEICAYDDEEEDEEDEDDDEAQNQNEDAQDGENAHAGNEVENEEDEEENEEDEEGQQQPAAQQPALVTAPAADSPKREGREGQQGFRPTAESRQPRAVFSRTSPLPEHDEELDDEELIKAIRQLASLT